MFIKKKIKGDEKREDQAEICRISAGVFPLWFFIVAAKVDSSKEQLEKMMS